MFDELDRLRADGKLRQLLSHYAQLGAVDRETWQDRLMEMDGTEPQELSELHGELIAHAWIEVNTGPRPLNKPGVVACCYRVTAAGIRALKTTTVETNEKDCNAVAA
jgi:hypothetical protein